jgi:hypothetical protein
VAIFEFTNFSSIESKTATNGLPVESVVFTLINLKDTGQDTAMNPRINSITPINILKMDLFLSVSGAQIGIL